MAITDSNGKPLSLEDIEKIDDISADTPADTTATADPTPPAATFMGISPEDTTDTQPPEGGAPVTTDPNPDAAAETGEGATADDGVDDGKDEIDLKPDPDDDPAQYATAEAEKEFFSGVYDILADKGILSEGGEVTSEEQFAEVIENEVSARVNQRNQKIEDYMQAGIPYQEVVNIENALAQTEAITMDQLKDEELATQLVMADFMMKEVPKEEAEEFVSLYKSAGKLEEKATSALASRKEKLGSMLTSKIEEIKANNAQSELKRQEQADNLAESLEKGEILGKNITPVTRQKLKETLNTIVGKDPDTGQSLNAVMKYKLENPVEFEKNLLYLYTITNGFKSLKTLERSAETRITRKVRDAMSSMSTPNKSFVTGASDTPSTLKFDPNEIDDIVDPKPN